MPGDRLTAAQIQLLKDISNKDEIGVSGAFRKTITSLFTKKLIKEATFGPIPYALTVQGRNALTALGRKENG